jgi:ATP-binding cassette subfamily F protein 3
VALGQAAHDLETRLEAKMALWSEKQAEVEAKGG